MNRALINTGWILTEKVLFALAGIFINVYVARYLGPEAFGLIGFSIAIVGLITPLVKLGSDNIVFNRLAKNQQSGLLLLETSAQIRAIAFVIFCTLLTAGAFFYFERSQQIVVFCIIVWGSYFTSNDIYSIFFNSSLNAKFNTIAQNISLLFGVVLKIAFIKLSGNIVYFAGANVLQWMISFFIKRHFYQRETKQIERTYRKKSPRHIKHLLKVGLPLAFSSLSIAIYTKTDQIMLGAMLDETHVGYYSAALTLAQGWLFLPMAIITSYMVRINEAARQNDSVIFDRKVRKLFSMVFFITLLPALVIGIFREPLVDLLYGQDYMPAASILAITVVSSMFSAMGYSSYGVITVLGGYSFLLKKMVAISLLNIVLNFLLIPQFGLAGAAIATMISEILSAFLLNIFYRKGRVFRLQLEVFALHKLKETIKA
ncbi:flippase [Phytohalomonas tamaricis]|uniref:flippase n=1 Tax=Phytohalomonas tamaricis TaxID=2081032 RepID=UPI001319EF36|nr:flippase [Phytohalomonas tamaricis]